MRNVSIARLNSKNTHLWIINRDSNIVRHFTYFLPYNSFDSSYALYTDKTHTWREWARMEAKLHVSTIDRVAKASPVMKGKEDQKADKWKRKKIFRGEGRGTIFSFEEKFIFQRIIGALYCLNRRIISSFSSFLFSISPPFVKQCSLLTADSKGLL